MMYKNTKQFWTLQHRAYKQGVKNGNNFDSILKTNPYAIKFISGATQNQQIVAVKSEPKVLKYLRGPSTEVQELAVRLDPSTIEYVKNPTDEMWLYALEKTPRLIFKVRNPTWEMIYLTKDRISKINTHKGFTQDMRAYFTLVS